MSPCRSIQNHRSGLTDSAIEQRCYYFWGYIVIGAFVIVVCDYLPDYRNPFSVSVENYYRSRVVGDKPKQGGCAIDGY